MPLTDPISYTLELFQCLTGRGWSDNQFLFLKNWKRFVKSFPIRYFQYSKNLMLLPTMDGHVFHVNSLHDYGLWWSRATEVIEYSCKVSDQWRETKKNAFRTVFMPLLPRVPYFSVIICVCPTRLTTLFISLFNWAQCTFIFQLQ